MKENGKNRHRKKWATRILTYSPNLNSLYEKNEALERKMMKYKKEENKDNRKKYPKLKK